MNRFFVNLLTAAVTFSLGVFVSPRPRPAALEPAALTIQTIDLGPSRDATPPPVAATPEDVKPNYEYLFETKTVREKVPDWYEIDVEYPRLKKAQFPNEFEFNRMLKQLVLDDVAEFRGLENQAMRTGKSPGIEESLVIGYEVIGVRNDVYSIKFTHTVMAGGQMHPIDYPVTVNYDLAFGRTIAMRDIFKPKTKYLEAISRYCRAELKRQYGENDFMMRGTEPKAENFQHWNLTPEGLLISFDDYQVGPHSMGQPVLLIPYSALDEFRVDEKILHRLINSESDEGHTCSKPTVVVEQFA